MVSISMMHPTAYRLADRLINFSNGISIDSTFSYISRLIGGKKNVLDLGCGPAILFNYLDNSCKYEGWDTNKYFVRLLKNKVNVKYQNILNFRKFPEADIIFMRGVLHYIYPKHIELIKNSLKHAKQKVIIAEQYKDSTRIFPDKFHDFLKKNVSQNLFCNKGKINQTGYENIFTKAELLDLLNKFNIKSIYENRFEIIASLSK